MIGRKLYYELSTGNVILEIPEKHNIIAIETTKEQDFLMYDALQGINPDSVGFIQLDYGQFSPEFQSANSVRIDLDTQDVLFEYPIYHPPLITQLEMVKTENYDLKVQLQEQEKRQETAQQALDYLIMGGM